MGRVFSVAEIAEGRVPTSYEVSDAAERLQVLLHNGLEKGLLHSVIIFGSASVHAYSPRSNIDVFAAYHRHREPAAIELLRAINLQVQPQNAARVAINSLITSREDIVSGRHPIDLHLAHHLFGTRDQVIALGPPLADEIRLPDISSAETFTRFVQTRIEKLQKAYVSGEESIDTRALECLLKTPLSTARRYVQHCLLSQATPCVPSSQASSAFLDFLAERLTENEDLRTLSDLSRSNGRYNMALSAAKTGQMPHDSYNEYLSHLYALMPSAIALLRSVGTIVVQG